MLQKLDNKLKLSQSPSSSPPPPLPPYLYASVLTPTLLLTLRTYTMVCLLSHRSTR